MCAVQRSDSRVVQTGRYGVGLADVSVGVLHHEGARSVQYARFAQVYGRGCLSAADTFARRFGQNDSDAAVVDVVIDGSGGIAASSDAGYKAVG